MTDKSILENIIAISNKKSLEWHVAQKRIDEILSKLSNYQEFQPEEIKYELESEIRRMWSDLETYKIELEMQNDELINAFKEAEEVKTDYIELFNSSPAGYLILDSRAIILNANQTFADMVKTELSQIYQHPFQRFIAKEDISNFLSRFKSYFKKPSDKFFELTLNDSKKHQIVVRLEGIRKKISGFTKKSQMAGMFNLDKRDVEEELLLISLSDITQLKQVEEEKEILKNMLLQARKMEAIGTLAAGIAHDFNNILFPILGFGEMLKDELSNLINTENLAKHEDYHSQFNAQSMEKVSKTAYIDSQAYEAETKFCTLKNDMMEMVDNIINNTKRAKSLVNQILAFSKYTATSISPFYINLILTEIIVALRPSLPSNMQLIERIDNSCSMVMLDADKMKQVITNLITNAVQAMEDRGGTLTITLTEDDFNETCSDTGVSVNGRYVCLSVKDTGLGIEKQHLSRIFDPYFSTKPKFKAAGLGLSLVHGIVNSHKGKITVISEPGKGSEFRIFLPCYVADNKEDLIPRKLKSGTEKILIIDDQVSITRVLSTMLQRLGYSVVTFNDPAKALDNIKEMPKEYDLIISDMTMPEMPGDDVARNAMKINPEIPILILTGYSERLSPEEAVQMGIKGYLMKPVTLAELSDSVRRAIDGV